MINIDDIKKFFRGRIALSEPLNKYTSLRIGGPADYYFEPFEKNDAVQIINYLQKQEVPFVPIGKGSNLLVNDEGYRGAVVNLQASLTSIEAKENCVNVEAGISLNQFVDFCIRHGLKGVEMLAGIPGTIGGAIKMNAGAYGGEISDYLLGVEIIRGGLIVNLKKAEIGFEYRFASFEHDDVILSASFQLPVGNYDELMKIRNDLLLQRNKKHPVNYPNCGSVFINPGNTPAAKYIEESGLKGARSGDAQISDKHANFIINIGNATAKDVMTLIEKTRNTVKDKFGILLELEVKLLGFEENVYKEQSS
ncbi:MAG: UDP-N-acetylmuramate dehydrogenase [Bacteroidota bacterium]|nr:UDP-N-acetylmuramate dehydrogenase [Bacteroidota bacterium]